MKTVLPWSAAIAILACSLPATASTGTCDMDPGDTGPSEVACISAIQALGPNVVVADIFKDSNGKTGDQLIYGQLVDPYATMGGCTFANTICNGDLSTNQGTPAVICVNALRDFNVVADFTSSLDWRYANPVRLHDAHGSYGPNPSCPDFADDVTDGNKEGYKPWEGLVFDLGGPSNKVVLFPVNDHGPQPCESIEYTVYLTDNPASRELIDDPTTLGADPQKWNRAHLSQLFLEGWKKVRPGVDPGLNYTIEADSFTSVWSLPCGINFKYVGVIAGNDGHDLPACNYDSFDAELDAVAGLTEGGAGICPDADNDKYVDCNCPTAPPICDCNDGDPTIHPGAPEACDDPDKNCDKIPGACTDKTLTCYQHICIPTCGGEDAACPKGSVCTPTAEGKLCVPSDCTNAGCPNGSICEKGVCVPACTGVVCPGDLICQDGACIDPCQGHQCPAPQVCQGGVCLPPCSCFQGDAGCAGLPGTVCDRNGTGLCELPGCVGVMCMANQVCDPTTMSCIDYCNKNVKCPEGQKCLAPVGCVPLCDGVTCVPGFECDPTTGQCFDSACKGVSCIPPAVCMGGKCIDMGAGGGGSGSGTGGAPAESSSSSTGGAGGVNTVVESTGCGCVVAGVADRDLSMLALGVVGLGAFAARKRRRGLPS